MKTSEIKDVEQIPTQAIVNITAKVIETVEEIQEVLVWNRKTPVKTVKVGDQSGAINLKLWSDNIEKIVLGMTYKFTSLGVWEYMGRKYLTTTPSSSWLVVDDIPNINEEDVGIKENVVVRGEVTLVTVTLSKACLSCRKTVTATDTGSPFVKCPECKMKMKKDKMIDNMLCKLSVEGNSSKYLVPSAVMTEFLISTQKEDIQGNADEIENHLLTCGEIKMEIPQSTSRAVSLKLVD
ncbi:uncharacterized protein LOC124142078 [Haliotis rufescens]|uniref:uncharacterized protein LOC124142078 n=1 Tax=Haliotis rufescens TaxID=6454 RepID=UPI00201E9A1D|nr:uncharacterized protein LOC124142078 [Haliotis rufescens]